MWKNNLADSICRFQIGMAEREACGGGVESQESCQHLPEDRREPGKHVYIVRTIWIHTDFWPAVRHITNTQAQNVSQTLLQFLCFRIKHMSYIHVQIIQHL